MANLLKNRLARNMVSLYAVQGCTYLLPLITFPYLGRVLGPDGWGSVLFAQSIGAIIAIAVEYGFDFSATRETARFPDDKSRLGDLVAGVLGAKVLLALGGIALALVIRPFTLRIAPSPALFWMSLFWGIAQGINMLWYFQGLQRMAWAGGLDITGKAVATLSIFVLVHSPQDGWKVMASQAVGCAVSHAITVGIAYREVGFRWPRFSLVRDALRLGWPMFLFRASQSLFTSANGLILGFFASPNAVGLFGGADKIRQVAGQSLWPISQTLFPHQSQRVREDPRAGMKVVRRSLLLLGGLSALFGLILALAAPVLVRVTLGSAFVAAIPTLRVFGAFIPLQTLIAVVSFQWMLPLGFDRKFNLVIIAAGIFNVAAGIPLVLGLGTVGMAIAVTGSQLFSLLALDWVLRRNGLSPFGRTSLGVEVEEPVAVGVE